MTDVIRKTYFYKRAQIAEYDVKKPLSEATWYSTANKLFEHAHDVCDRIASAHPLYEPACRMPELVVDSDEIIHHTFDAGEGVLIPGEILHHAEQGCRAFVISSDKDALNAIGLRPSLKKTLYNGAIECRFLGYELFDGDRKEYAKNKKSKE